MGRVSKSKTGNNDIRLVEYNNFGFISKKQSGQFTTGSYHFNWEYSFNINSGNLNWRRNLNILPSAAMALEVFEYDNNRLKKAYKQNQSSTPLFQIDYNAIGNITEKSDVGEFQYHPTKIHAIKKVDNSDDLISTNQQNITFNEQNRASEITEGNYKALLQYDEQGQRTLTEMMITEDATLQNPSYALEYKRIYVGDYEKEIRRNDITEVCYISTPTGLTAAYVTQNSISQIHYLHTDHLGSIIGVTDANGIQIYKTSFDSWGRKRNNEDWSYNNLNQAPSWLWRGYTGHEHLEEFALINMNARLYDPILGRMLSPDNYVSNATNSQDYNRYTYARNNPLKYVDPDGNEPVSATVIVIAGVIGGTMNVAANWSKIDNFGQGALYFGIGAGAGISSLFTFGAGGGIVTAVGNGLMQGQDAGTITKNAMIGATVGVISAGVASGMTLLGTPNYDAIGNLAGRYAAKVGYSMVTGFVVGSTANATQQFILSEGDLSTMNPNQILRSGIAAGATSGAIALAFCAYDYATWDRYDGKTKVDILNRKYGGGLKYLSEDDYNSFYKDDCRNLPYGKDDGITDSYVSYITDKGLTSRSWAEMTYIHEARHVSQYRSGVDGSTPTSEFAAYSQEFMVVNKSTPSRYVNETNLGRRGSYYEINNKSYSGYRNIYNNKFSNHFINIFR
jgi:RHS repeat-associated protein